MSQNLRIVSCMLHSCPLNEKKLNGRLMLTTERVHSALCCGNINTSYFVSELYTYIEGQNYNTCLNQKITIDKDGFIKNCPSMQSHFGHVSNTTLEKVLTDPNFSKFWNITKDKIHVCKDCEFRYICTDCRAYVEDPDDLYSKPLKCGYNPYTSEWSEWSDNPLKQPAIEYYGMEDLVKLNAQ